MYHITGSGLARDSSATSQVSSEVTAEVSGIPAEEFDHFPLSDTQWSHNFVLSSLSLQAWAILSLDIPFNFEPDLSRVWIRDRQGRIYLRAQGL